MWLRSEDDDHTQTQFVNSGSFHDLRRGLSSNHYLHSLERQGISPSVGDLHFSIRVTESVKQVIIWDADVPATGIGPESTAVEIGPLAAKRSLIDPTFSSIDAVV